MINSEKERKMMVAVVVGKDRHTGKERKIIVIMVIVLTGYDKHNDTGIILNV